MRFAVLCLVGVLGLLNGPKLLVDGFVLRCPELVRLSTNNIKGRSTLLVPPLFLSKTAAAATVSTNEELLPGIAKIDAANTDLCKKLENLRDQPFFSLYSVDILASCEYMPQELFECYSETCEIYPVDEEEVPPDVKDIDSQETDFELDGWARWDMPTDDYYDMVQFPEDYTGYDGSDVWNFIHNRLCFSDDDKQQEYKADFNKAVSGVHSMISAQIIRGIQDRIESGEDFTDDEQKWSDPVAEFNRRLSPGGGSEAPLALENLYFCYMLLLSAVAAARDRLVQDTGKMDEAAADALRPILSMALLDDADVQVAAGNLRAHAQKETGSLWEVRMRTRELQRIMNCVLCNKCRLHGKISMMGFSTALQVLIGGPSGKGEDPSRLHRVELASLLVTLSKFSRAIETCRSFQND